MANRLTLILGGARSGKSAFAEKLAQARGDDTVVFVATAEAQDAEMRARIDAHRAHRPTAWQTIEAPRHIAHALQQARVNSRVVVIDCLTLLVSNVLLVDEGEADAELIREMDELVAWQRSQALEMIVVSNEVGQGIVPDHALGRVYRDLLGTTNQHIARQADQVFLMVAGMPIEVKSRAFHLENL